MGSWSFWSPEVCLLIAGIIAIAGFTKGFTGIGLPVVAVPLLALVVDVRTTVVLMAVSIVVTNLWQAFSTDNWLPAIKRFWPVMLPMPVAAYLGVAILSSADPTLLIGVLGAAVLCFGLIMQVQIDWRIPRGLEPVFGPVAGAASATLGGMSSMFAPPLIVYYSTVRIDREVLIATFGLTYLFGVVPMVGSLAWFGILGPSEVGWSTLVAVPGFGGMLIGQALRGHAPERFFRRAMLTVLMASGVTMLYKAMGSLNAIPMVKVPLPPL
ncbi:MAG: sulfite exporter TauE/SafE family protein [Alphaproteobacteria bacterium]